MTDYLRFDALSGRLMVRSHHGEGASVVGLLRISPAGSIQEGDAFVAYLTDYSISLGQPSPTHHIGNELYYSVSDMLTQQLWPRAATPGGMVLRLLPAFPERNEWIAFAATERSWLPSDPMEDDVWFDVAAGRLSYIDAPVSSLGMLPGQVLGEAVWPSCDGKLYALPQIGTLARTVYARYRNLLVAWANAEISRETLVETVRADPQIRAFAPYGNPDIEYAQFLALLSRNGLLSSDCPRTAQDKAQADAAAIDVVRQMRPD